MPKELVSQLESARATRAMLGERRVVTILFCDVTGSTAAAEQFDPEEWAEIMNGAFEHMIRPVYQYEGTIARLMGDAILAFFGAPIAHEDDPQRAVLAGLGIISGIQAYQAQAKREWGIQIDVRVGINTGLVVVGGIGSDLRMEYTAMGDAINLASRMEQTAIPGTVQVAEDTYKLVEPLFDFEVLGEVEIKGKAEPVKTYRPLRQKATPGRLRGIAGLDAPLIGRANERAVLESALENLGKGIGGILCLIGEAGIGKSRLLQEVKRSNEGQTGFQWIETYNLSYESEQPYGLFRRLMRRVIAATPEDGPESTRQKIQRAVEAIPPEERTQVQSVLESLFGLVSATGEPPLEGETFKGLLYTVMTAWWQNRAKLSPVVLVCDDVHWSDPASVALLKHMFPLTNHVAILMVFAMRPDQDAPAIDVLQSTKREFPHRYIEIRLGPLNDLESEQLVDSLLKITDFPAAMRSHILEKSEGNPYFVEEVVRTLIERGVVVQSADGASWRSNGSDENLEIPGNLKSLLVARIDRLPEGARHTLQFASVIGRSFSYRTLQRLVDITEPELSHHMITLQETQLIQEVARLPEPEYHFLHALMQEAVYSTILLKQRRSYHRRVGEALEALYPDRRDEMCGALAAHFLQARDFAKALGYYRQAGDTAYRLHAVAEAVTQYDQALTCAAKIEVESEQLVYLYTRRGRALELAGRFEEALGIYQEMEAVAMERNDDDLLLASLSAQSIVRATQTPLYDPPQARSLAEQALALAQRLGDRATEAKVLWGMLLVEAWGDGDNQKALAYGLRSLEIARELGLKEQTGYTYTNLVNVYWGLDQVDAAWEAIRAAQAIWEEIGNLPMLADSYTMRQFSLIFTGKWNEARALADKSLQFSESIGNIWNQLIALLYLSQSSFELGDFNLALMYAHQCSKLREETGFQPQGIIFSDLWQRLMISLAVGALEEAESLADELSQKQHGLPSIFRSTYLASVIRTKLRCGQIQPAVDIIEDFVQEIDLARMGTIFKGDWFAAEIHLMLARGDYEMAVTRAQIVVETFRGLACYHALPDVLLLQATAHIVLAQHEHAVRTLEEALAISRDNGERRLRWEILANLAELEAESGNTSKAHSLRAQAREVITFIAEHAGREDLRASFLALPKVQAMLSDTGGNHV